jgi:hypothetical protein
MALLLKDCGLEGFKGSVQRCDECRRATVHFRRPGGWPICGVCGTFALPAQASEAPTSQRRLPSATIPLLPVST